MYLVVRSNSAAFDMAFLFCRCTLKGEEDYRPLFENFVYDLLATVNKPEWPAAELLLSLLGRLLVKQFSNKAVDMTLRVASLDYLGIVASRLRKDAVTSKLNEKTITDIIKQVWIHKLNIMCGNGVHVHVMQYVQNCDNRASSSCHFSDQR